LVPRATAPGVAHHYVGTSWPVAGVAVVDAGAARADGARTAGVAYDPGAGSLNYTAGACVSAPGWTSVSAPFTVVTSFSAPPLPPAGAYTVWQAGREPDVARLYVADGALNLGWGNLTVTGGAPVAPGASVSAAAWCDVGGCFVATL
jgi:hypothetical protein